MGGIASILVVDDNPKYLKDALPMYGYDVTVAEDGLEALKILTEKKEAFDLNIENIHPRARQARRAPQPVLPAARRVREADLYGPRTRHVPAASATRTEHARNVSGRITT